MRKYLFYLLLSIFPLVGFGQCLTAPGGQYPAATFTPPCNLGNFANVTTAGWAGEYSKVNVTAGVEYVFASSVATDFITISNNGGTTAYVWGTGSVTWTATATEVVRFYTHTNPSCGTQNVNRARRVACGNPIVYADPAFDCFMGDGSPSSLEDGLTVTTTGTQRIADDFVVDPGTKFILQEVTLNLLSATDIAATIINIRANNAGVPGAIVNTFTMAPTSSTLVGTNFGLNFYRVTYDLVTPVELTEGTYWIDPSPVNAGATAVYWETTSRFGSTGSTVKGSNNSGTTWTLANPVQAIFYVAGECGEIPENDNCDMAIALASDASETGATTFAGDSGANAAKDVFYTYTGTGASEKVTVSLCGSAYDTVVRVYSDCTLATEIASNDNSEECGAGSLQSQVEFISDGTSTYVIMVEGSGTETGDFNIAVSTVVLPANDDCDNAIALSCGDMVMGSTADATDSGENESGDVFYTYTSSDSFEQITISLCGSSYDTVVRVFTDCTLTEEIAMNDDNFDACGAGGNSQLTFNSDSAATYVIMVEGYEANTGDFELNISCFTDDYCFVSIPANRVEPISKVLFAGIDNSTDPAVDATPPQEYFLDIQGTVEAGETYPVALEGNTDGDFTNAFTVFIDWNQDNDFADAGEMYEAGSIVNSTGADGQQAMADIMVPEDAMEGTTRMRIIKDFTSTAAPEWPSDPCGSYDYGQVEDYTLSVMLPPELNDDCDTATMLMVGSDFAEFAMTGTLVDATDSGAGAPTCGTNGWADGNGDVWYSFVAPTNGNVIVETKAADGSTLTDTTIQVYSGDCMMPMAVACNDDDGDGNFSKATLSGLTAGETYHIRVWEYGGDIQDTFQVSVYGFVPPANDDCDMAIALSCGDMEEGSTANATDSGGNTAGDVFYTFTGTGAEEMVTVSLCGSDYDTVVRIFSDCTMTEEIAMNDDSTECGGTQSQVSFVSDGTSTYVIMVEGYGVNTGNYTINVSCDVVPEGCQPALNCTDGDNITNVTFAGINNDTECSEGGYGDYTDQEAQVEAGMSYDLSVTVGSGWYERVSAWIDWNNDGMFDADEFLGEIGEGGTGVTLTESIMIPAGTADGMYAMRLLVYATGTDNPAIEDPCINDLEQFGEYEDYTVTVGEASPMTNCEEQVVPSNNLENGLFFGGDGNQLLAADVVVGDAGYTVYGVDLNVFTDGNTDLNFTVTFYEDEAGLPGAVHAITTASIHNSEFVGNAFGFDVYNYVIDFATDVDLAANTTYWMQVESDGLAWEATTATILGSGLAFNNTNTSGAWTNDPATELVYDLICEELGVSDMSSFDFTYYPNPVKDVLNISAKKAVNNIAVYNLAGQQVMSKVNVNNGQVDVASLTPGVYVFRVTLEGGQVETFKIIKK